MFSQHYCSATIHAGFCFGASVKETTPAFSLEANIGSGSDSMRYSRSSRLCVLVCKGQVTSKSVGLCFKWTDICSRAGGGHHPSNTMALKCVGVTRYPSDVSAIHHCTSLLSAKYKVSEQNF